MHRNGWTRIIAVLLTVGTALAQQQPAESQRAAEQPPVTFEADVNFVEVPTIVTDRNGDFVRGLSADDFEVFEDGERQTITVFSLVDLPVLRPFTPVYAEAPVDADVHETRPTFDGRLYVLMLDDLHTSALRTQQVRQYAKRFVEQSLGANDLAAVLYTGGQADGQELTSRRSLLLQAIDRFQGRKLPSATGDRLGVHLQLQRDEEMSFDDPELVERQRPITSDRGIEDPNDTETRSQRPKRTRGTQQRGRVDGQRARQAEGHSVVQRRARLRHLRAVQPKGLAHSALRTRRDRCGAAGQRQHLRGRCARSDTASRRGDQHPGPLAGPQRVRRRRIRVPA